MVSGFLTGLTLALSVGSASAGVRYAGVNIAGFDFGCGTDGTCTVSSVDPPQDGAGQMQHFTKNDGFSIYRLPVAWQYLVDNNLGATLDSGNLATYDKLVQACLATGSACIIDIHNYARWNGQIIGQGGPTNDQFASLWSQLATKYKNTNVVMGIMNEPHDIPDITTWAASVQAAVTAIRQAGATDNMILLPGNDYTSAGALVSSGSASALSTVKNLDGSTTNLIFDVHKYLDSDGSGTSASCVSNQITDSFAPLATWLRQNKRMAILSETGGGSSDSSCLTYLCQAIDFLNSNSDAYLGYTGWAAGSFAASYVLSLTPTGSASSGYSDQPLLKCFQGGSDGSSNISSSAATAASSTGSYTPTTMATVTLSNNGTYGPTPSVNASTAPRGSPGTSGGTSYVVQSNAWATWTIPSNAYYTPPSTEP